MRIFLVILIFVAHFSIAQNPSVDCLYDYFYSEKNIGILSADTISINRSTETLIPLGWSKTGKFTYYIVPQNICGLCSAKLECFDVASNKVIGNNSFDFQNLMMEGNEKKCLEVKKIERMKQNLLTNHSIIPLIKSDFKYINLKNSDFSYANHKFNLKQNKKSGTLTLSSPDGKTKTLSNIPLGETPAQSEMGGCDIYVHLNGYFINPHNPKQIIIHILKIEPCGFEGEDYYSNLLIGLTIN